MDSVQTLVTDVERDLLLEITTHLKQNKLSGEQAQELARSFLAVLPVQDKEELLTKLKKLGEEFPEAQSVFLKYAKEDELHARDQKLSQMALHIKSGNIEQALKVAKS